MARQKQDKMHDDPTFNAKSRSTWDIIRRVSVYLKPYKLLAASTMGSALLSLGFSFAYPQLIQTVIDEVINKRQAEKLIPVILALLGAFLLRDLFTGLRILINN